MPRCARAARFAALEALCERGPRYGRCRERPGRGLSLPAHARTSPADDRRRADAHTTQNAARPRPYRLFYGLRRRGRIQRGAARELETVQGHYARLFERDAAAGGGQGAISSSPAWTTIPKRSKRWQEWVSEIPHHVSGAIRGWHHGRIRATRSARAREMLTKLVPALLDALAATADPDAAFAQFDRFLSRSAGRRAACSRCCSPIRIFCGSSRRLQGSAPRLADHLARSPATLDALLDADFFAALPSREKLDRALAQAIVSFRDYEGVLDAVRRFAREQIFRVGVRIDPGRRARRRRRSRLREYRRMRHRRSCSVPSRTSFRCRRAA